MRRLRFGVFTIGTLVTIAGSAAAHASAHPVPTISARMATRLDTLADLPLTVVPAVGTPTNQLAVLLTGDGGWAGIDKQLADSIAHHGIPVVALNSRKYFSTQRNPDVASHDLERILRHYLAALDKARILLIGYSRGADVLPFMATRLPADLADRVQVIALLGPAPNANFKFHTIDLISNRHRKDDLMTVPEIEKLRGKRILCFYGVDEKESACRSLDSSVAMSYAMPGGHHFDKKYGEIADRILEAAGG